MLSSGCPGGRESPGRCRGAWGCRGTHPQWLSRHPCRAFAFGDQYWTARLSTTRNPSVRSGIAWLLQGEPAIE